MSEKSFLFGKRFLITQPMIRSFCGSTVVTLELARYLLSIGAQVTVYTNVAFLPALSFFSDAGIKVISSREDYDFSLDDYDYIWIHSLTFPQKLLDELKHPLKRVPIFVFLHMSPLESIPDEHPWIFGFENSLSALSLYISEKTLESNKKYGLPPRTEFFRNPAPLEYMKLTERIISQRIMKLLIVSNHPPEEIIEAKKILIGSGIDVELYGEGQDKYEPISPDVLEKYDAVITIGKTVQYCIVGSMPVYIYDWFGGPGWLNKANYEFTKARNFSGRSSSRKTGEEIAQEIMNDYNKALSFHFNFLAKNKDEFIIDKVLDSLLKGLKPRRVKPFNSEYIESAKAAVGCAEIRFIASEELGDVCKSYDDLAKQLDEYRKLTSQYKEKYESLSNSKRVRFLNALLKPQDIIRDSLKKRRDN